MLRRYALFALLALVVPAAEPITPGKYTGKWEGSSGASGEFRLTLTPAAGGAWTAEVIFTMGGEDVKCKMKSVTVTDSKLRVVYTFDLQGNDLESTIEGELSGKKLSGKYTTREIGDGSPVDEGTWEATAS